MFKSTAQTPFAFNPISTSASTTPLSSASQPTNPFSMPMSNAPSFGASSLSTPFASSSFSNFNTTQAATPAMPSTQFTASSAMQTPFTASSAMQTPFSTPANTTPQFPAPGTANSFFTPSSSVFCTPGTLPTQGTFTTPSSIQAPNSSLKPPLSEAVIKETAHKAAMPVPSIARENNDLETQIGQIEKLLLQVKIQLVKSSETFEDMREKGNSLFSDLELALFSLEKFKNPSMRSTLYVLDKPIERYFKKRISAFGHTLGLLKPRIEANDPKPLADEHIGILISNPDLLACKLKEFLKSIVQMASEISALEEKLNARVQTKQKA
ncbi:hypothetical protein MDAP_001152 [Mitosporidium daphniae]